MSWRRATAHPFGPDGTFSFAGSPYFQRYSPHQDNRTQQQIHQQQQQRSFSNSACSQHHNNNNQISSSSSLQQQQQQPVFRRRLEEAIGGQPQQQVRTNSPNQQQYHVSQQYAPSNAREQEGIVRSPRRTGTTTGGVSYVTGSGAIRNATGNVVAYNQTYPQANYQQNLTYPQYDPPTHEQLVLNNAVEEAINSARSERDAAKRDALSRELEAMHYRREASDAANTALSSHRQHMMIDNALRTAEARIHELEVALDAEARHYETQMKRAQQTLQETEIDFNNRVAQEHETVVAINDTLDEKEKEVEELKRQVAELTEKLNEANHEIGTKQVEVERLQAQIEAMTHQKSELSSFYEKSVVDSKDMIRSLQRKHEEEIVALQAEHSMQKIRLDEALTRATIGEEASRQALEVIHNRLNVLCGSFDSSSVERDRQNQLLSNALCELRAASASALSSLADDHQQNVKQVNLELAQEGELRTQIRRLQSALENAQDEKSALQTKSEMLVRELEKNNNNSESARGSQQKENPASLVRQAVAREVVEEVIEHGVATAAASAEKRKRELDSTLTPSRAQQQQQQAHYNNNNNNESNTSLSPPTPPNLHFLQNQQQSENYYGGNNNNNNYIGGGGLPSLIQRNLVSPRAGSIAARLTVLSVRGLAIRPEFASHKVKVSTLVFGPLGQQLCDVECDEHPVSVLGDAYQNNNNNNYNNTFSNQSFHFKRDGRFPVSVYLHPADPSVIVVHIWARVIVVEDQQTHEDQQNTKVAKQQQQQPRRFLGCVCLPVADVLNRGPGTRVLKLKAREPHETDMFIKDLSNRQSLGFVTIDVSGPFAAQLDAPALQNDALDNVLNFSTSGELSGRGGRDNNNNNYQNNNNNNNVRQIKQQRQIGVPPPSVPALNLTPSVDAKNKNSRLQNQNQQQQDFYYSGLNNTGTLLSTFTAEIWIRSITYLKSNRTTNNSNKFYFCDLLSKTTKQGVLTTPKMRYDGDDAGSSFWPKSDATITVTMARNEGFLLQLFETLNDDNDQQQEYFASSGGGGASSRSASKITTPRLVNEIDTRIVGCADIDAPYLLSEFQKPTTKQFGGAHSDRKAISIYLEPRTDTRETTAIVELVVRIVP